MGSILILAGDIGGTHSRFALFTDDGKRMVRYDSLSSVHYQCLEEAARAFLGKRSPKITSACLGISGPVIRQRCVATNLPWVVDARLVARRLKIKRVTLINDLVALALGALTVPKTKLRLLRGDVFPKKKGANLAIIAAGTGLGEASLLWDGYRLIPHATEGGHVDFAPRTNPEIELLRFLQRKYKRVSYERILSGPGLGNLYDFFLETEGMREKTSIVERLRTAPDRSSEISRLATIGESEIAVRAVDMFVRVYGAQAGNLALNTLALGGIFVTGGLSIHLSQSIGAGSFNEAFVDKGRMGALLEKVPVALVNDPDVGLAGSAYYATRP